MLAPTSLILIAAQLVIFAESACPPDMTEVGTPAEPWCVKKYSTPVTFCNAVKTCHENGQEMISKPVYDAMKASGNIPVGMYRWWVGLVDALNERGHQKGGWVWIKDGQVTAGNEGYFYSGEPNDIYKQDCMTVMLSNKQLRDETCDETNPFYCYSDAAAYTRATTKPDHGKFNLVEIMERTQPDPGCWQTQPNAKTLQDCTLACLQFQFSDCVGFYWHPARRQCVLLPYFDASLPLDSMEFSANSLEKMQWTKYQRTE